MAKASGCAKTVASQAAVAKIPSFVHKPPWRYAMAYCLKAQRIFSKAPLPGGSDLGAAWTYLIATPSFLALSVAYMSSLTWLDTPLYTLAKTSLLPPTAPPQINLLQDMYKKPKSLTAAARHVEKSLHFTTL